MELTWQSKLCCTLTRPPPIVLGEFVMVWCPLSTGSDFSQSTLEEVKSLVPCEKLSQGICWTKSHWTLLPAKSTGSRSKPILSLSLPHSLPSHTRPEMYCSASVTITSWSTAQSHCTSDARLFRLQCFTNPHSNRFEWITPRPTTREIVGL